MDFANWPSIEAAIWAFVASLGLVGGAYFGTHGPFEHAGIARTMAIGAGVLLAAATIELIAQAIESVGVLKVGVAFLFGASAFSLINAWLGRRKATHRKRCGGCVKQPTEAQPPGSGLAIAIGTMLDTFPEAVVLGLQTHGAGFPGWTLIAAIAIGNFAEATSSASGMQVAGRNTRYIFGVWVAVSAGLVVVAATAASLANFLVPTTESLCQAFAAGALLAMIVETMIPEAAEDSLPYNGLMAAFGFLLVVVLGDA